MDLKLEACSAERRRAIEAAAGRRPSGPEDDMWSAFAEQAAAFLIHSDGAQLGCAAVDEVRVLHRLSLFPRFEDRGEELLTELIARLELIAALPSTLDSAFLSLSLTLGKQARPVALMFEHALEPTAAGVAGLRAARAEDHAASLAFARETIGGPESFLGPYLKERIDLGELRLLEEGGAIIGSGELRLDKVHEGFAHLGVIVDADHRRRGLGRGILAALVAECQSRGLRPLCSTAPDNAAARRAIHEAGFRSRHRIFQVSFADQASP